MHADPHLASSNLAYTSAAASLDALAAGETTSEALVSILLSRIAQVDAPDSQIALRSILAINSDALATARERDEQRSRGELLGPLHGLPVLIKDNIEAVGLPGTAGATSLSNRPVTHDAELVQHLRKSGAIILGATNLSQWANIRSSHSSSGWSAVGGLTGNPWSLDRSAGGSSSGSGAAVAAGLAPVAVGSETDGSIVCPASLNGVVGIKPTVGSVSGRGVIPISASQDSPGPLARSVQDAALLLDVLRGDMSGTLFAVANEATSDKPGANVRIGALRNYRSGHPATDALFESVVAALHDAGFAISESDAPTPPPAVGQDELVVLLHELVDDLSAHLRSRGPGGPMSLAEVIEHEKAHAGVEMPWFGHDLLEKAAASGGRANEKYAGARSRNLAWALDECLLPALENNDVLIAPSYAPAWKIDLTNGDQGLASPVTRPAAIAGFPIGCLPMGIINGLPVGLAFIAGRDQEAVLVRAMAQVEAALALQGPRYLRPTFAAARRG